MAKHNHDPSSSLEENRLTRRGVLAGIVGGATVLIVGCGKDRVAVPPDYSTQSASPSESPSASPSPSETVDPEVAARMRAREEYEKQVAALANVPYDQFVKQSSKERDAVLQAELGLAKAFGWTKDRTKSDKFYPKDSSVSFGAYWDKPASPDDDPDKILAHVLMPLQLALGGEFGGTVDLGSHKDYARKVAAAGYWDPEMRESVVHEKGMQGKITPEESGSKVFANRLINKAFEQISSKQYEPTDLPKVKEIARCEQSSNEFIDASGNRFVKETVHFYTYDGNDRGSAPSGFFIEAIIDPAVQRWKALGFPSSGTISKS
ncbi:MAG: hypothetical protein HXK97_02445 [Candidatus Nanogingivalaceae bacterium]|nr:hypothetical protein [Candidatus Nanogingivalaceae bacterium]